MLFLLANTALAQTVEVSGKVTDDKGAPISGVSVSEKNTRNGTSTNAAGEFKISVKSNAVLVFTSIGFGKKEVTVSGNTMNVSLQTSSETISEVVVTSYGIRREKKALGYAVATVEGKSIEQRPESDVVRLFERQSTRC